MSRDDRILEQRQTWAKGKLTVAWLTLCRAVEDPMLSLAWLEVLEKDVSEARAIAEDWGIDCKALIEELAASEVEAETRAR